MKENQNTEPQIEGQLENEHAADTEKENANVNEAGEAAETQEKELTKEEQLEKQLAESEQKAAEAADKYVRMAAEFDNYRRRTAKERLELISTAGEEVIKGLLPVLDDCERALQVLQQSNDSAAEQITSSWVVPPSCVRTERLLCAV